MPHYYLEGFENEFTLVRETPHSQMFKVKTPENRKLTIDIHYTMPKVLTVHLTLEGSKDDLKKSWMTPLFDEIARIALKRRDYAVIDYTIACASFVSDGNYSVDEKMREIMKNS